MIVDWPPNLVPTNIDIRPPSKTMGLTTSLSGFSQASPAIRPPFTVSLEFEDLHGTEVLAYRAMLAALEGRANQIRIPLFDLWFAARDAQIGAGGVTHSDGSSFSDGSLYTTDDISGVLVTAEQGTRYLTADFGEYGQLLQAGLYFGLGENPYMATQVSWDGSVATIRCSPTLRLDYEDEPLRLRPVMIGRLPEDDTGSHPLQRGRWTSPSITFVEDFS